MNLQYVEDIPRLREFRDNIIPRMADGHRYIPCSWAYMKRNTVNLMEFFQKGAPDNQILGHIVSVWRSMEWKNREVFENAFAEFKEAQEQFSLSKETI